MDVISKQNAEYYQWGENCDGWHLMKSDQLSVIQERVPPGSSEVKHYHQRANQFFFVLQGRAKLEVEETVYELFPQQGIEVRSGLSHQISNPFQEDVIFLVISNPKSHGDRILVGE